MGKMALPNLANILKFNINSKDHGFSNITERLQARTGRMSLSGRYHRFSRKMEDDYVLSETVLGSGYSGSVHLATSRLTQEKVAVKRLKLSGVPKKAREALISEVECFLLVDHPHITRLYDVYESQDHLCLVMECMEGGELFERVREWKTFTEVEAAHVISQMLLVVNYLHSHGIVHRDLKLENFLYDKKGSNTLKLIDFGFSKLVDPKVKMQQRCGTASYLAPEVMGQGYTSQCDLWSLGVISYILLSGRMPFRGLPGNFGVHWNIVLREEPWSSTSKEAKHFVRSLLEVDPCQRLTAQAALAHPWMSQVQRPGGPPTMHVRVAEALREFGHTSKFRRCCMEMVAWSLSTEERAKVRDYFISMDASQQGTITLLELRQALTRALNIPEKEIMQIFAALDSNQDEEIHYSDFLAAMVAKQIDLNDELMSTAFRKFDTDASGYITVRNLQEVVGNTFEGEEVARLLLEADQLGDGRLSYAEFAAFLSGTSVPRRESVESTELPEPALLRKPCSRQVRLPMFRPKWTL